MLLNGSRQSGKSTMAGIIALHHALTSPGSLTLILAPAERQARTLFEASRLVSRPWSRHARQLFPQARYGTHQRFADRSAPGSEKTIRGYSGVGLLILNEAARVNDALYYAVRPMLAVSGGSLMMLSTPFGKCGVFSAEWQGGKGCERYKIPATGAPGFSPGFSPRSARLCRRASSPGVRVFIRGDRG